MKQCKICRELKDYSEYYRSKRGFLSSYCKPCELNKRHIRSRNAQGKLKVELFNRLGGKCINCGSADIRVMDFHHKDSSIKRMDVKRNGLYRAPETKMRIYKTEIDNLELLCANCHRIHNFETIWKKIR